MEKILDGVGIGVSSGFILGLAFWLLDFVKIRSERRDQMEHLAKTIERFRGLIYCASELDMTLIHGSQQRRISKDEMRKAYFDDMRRQVEGILRGRASRLCQGRRENRPRGGVKMYHPGTAVQRKCLA